MTVQDRKKLDSNIMNFLRTGTLGRNITFQASPKAMTVLSQWTEVLCSSCFLSNCKNQSWIKCAKCDKHFHRNCVNSTFDDSDTFICIDCRNIPGLPDLVLEKIFEIYCSDIDGGNLKTLKLVSKQWMNVANLEHLQVFPKLRRNMRMIESKPDYQDVFSDIYQALKWLLRNHKFLARFPRLPTIISRDDRFLSVVRSFLIQGEPDRTYNNIEWYENDMAWYDDSMKNIMSECAFCCYHLSDMTYMINKTRELGIHISVEGPP